METLTQTPIFFAHSGGAQAAPGEGSYKIGVGANDVKGAADGGAGLEFAEDGGCIVVWGVAFEDCTGRFEELGGY